MALTSSTMEAREVASGVMNLGNTCYMNAVLQALAHAPELCLALDLEPHHVHCPYYKQLLKATETNANSSTNSNTVNSSNEGGRRKSKRSGKKSPSTDSTDDSAYNISAATLQQNQDHQQQQQQQQSFSTSYCTLCELEHHFTQVHAAGSNSSTTQAVAPASLVEGFLNNVAPPGFKLGIQEDSHEFLRLLIDAMQQSCRRKEESSSSPSPSSSTKDMDDHYPFKLFRGTVESNVCCNSCGATSSTIDPIEDIGLEVSSRGGGRSHTGGLSDLSSAFTLFTNAEPLTGYKCDKCSDGGGKATKQSKLASVPPILTLHLKRFRYGSDGKPLTFRRSREVLGGGSGASGSAKIEGHLKFPEIFDLRPYCTTNKKTPNKNNARMLCRLFAVIVHAGKNSHSGHYVAYVRNLKKSEWWKMDDARIAKVTLEEVLAAEAYMLFYRVVDHPIGAQLRARGEEQKKKQEQQQQPTSNEGTAVASTTTTDPPIVAPTASTATYKTSDTTATTLVGMDDRKRKRPASNTQDWAHAHIKTPRRFLKLFKRAEDFLADKIEFTPDFFKTIAEEAAANKGGGGGGPAKRVCEANVQGGVERFRPGLLDLFYRVAGRSSEGFFRRKKSPPPKNNNNNNNRILRLFQLLQRLAMKPISNHAYDCFKEASATQRVDTRRRDETNATFKGIASE